MLRCDLKCGLVLGLGALIAFSTPVQSQPPARPDGGPPRIPNQGGGPRGTGGPGGFPFLPPPIITALDSDKDGQISAAEWETAAQSLATLDANKDGELTDAELRPNFGPGRFPGGGRGGPGGGPGGRGGPGGESVGERIPAEKIKFTDGVARIPDHETYHQLSYKGEEVMIDTFLSGLEFVKFTLDQATSDKRELYFINTKTHRAHMMFARAAGLALGRGDEQMKGVLVYRPRLKSPSGKPGLYTFEFEPFDGYSFEMVKLCHDELIAKMPVLAGNIGYYPRGNRALAQVAKDQAKYQASDVKVYLDDDLNSADIAYLPLNLGESFGHLRLMELGQRPSPRDIVLYKALPNEMPRVAGIITAVRQTPLSHVNLRAIQDRVPNAFIAHAADIDAIRALIGKPVAYQVTADGYRIRAATADEVETHFAKLRPPQDQIPPRDLSVTKIRPLDAIKFQDSASVGVKAANVATLRTFGFRAGTVPDGYAIPFYFYDEFMKHNGFHDYAAELLSNPKFQQDRDTQEAQLKKFQSLIKKGKMPNWMVDALTELQNAFPAGTSIRCRSSTNNEDLPGFSGAGLYDSFTHRPDEGHLAKTVQQVFASLWNFRAVEERQFYRVDHRAAAMAVLVHPNFSDEQANGVAVTDDILYQTAGNYYVNTQVGEDLVTNPGELSIPEEILLDWWRGDSYHVMLESNRAPAGRLLLSSTQRDQLREYLGKIHARFARLYGKSLDDNQFAMEIEFKITRDGSLSIKQARPWVFAQTITESTTSQEQR